MATSVNNPTNAPPIKGQALPFIRKESGAITANANKDAFNDGKDYKDEGAPLLTTNYGIKPIAPYGFITNPLVLPPTREEMEALSHPDESSQTQIQYLKEAVVMDIDAKIIVSTMEQMKRGVFREAHYPTMLDYIASPHYKKLREAKAVAERLVGIGNKTRLRESDATIAGVRLNPRLVYAINKVDKTVIQGLQKKGFDKELKRLQESFAGSGVRLKEDSFTMEPNWDGGMSGSLAGRQPDFTPLIAGPFNKQLYWFDYLDMHSKCFEASTHNPVAKRIIKVITQFVLGKGVKLTVQRAIRKSDRLKAKQDTAQLASKLVGTGKQPPITIQDFTEQCQSELDQHWTQNQLHIRSKQILKDLLTFGEQFIRYFDAPWGLKIRQIDPSTVWEVVTDPDDCENEFYLHQQYPTRYQWYVDLPVPTIKFIIRQVPAALYYHMKINSTSGEVRGRSELFAILGWLKRLKEWASDRVVRNKMANLFILDVAVEGDLGAVQAVQQQFSTPPTPGSFFVHNKAAELQGVNVEIGANDASGDWEIFMTLAAMGAGLSKEYLGMSTDGGKAGALVGTEPDIKSFEDYQELMEQFFLQDAQRLFQRIKERGQLPQDVEVTIETTYPSLAEENRSEKLKDFAFGESMSWWSHRRTATAAAKEMQMTSYNYDEEQKQIAMEDAMKQVLLNTAYQQVTKGVDNSKSATGGGGTSSGGSGKGASGMGMGRLPGATSSSKQSDSTDALTGDQGYLTEAEDEDDEGLSATAPGTAFPARGSTIATTHNASMGDKRNPWRGTEVDASSGRRDHYRGQDPRDIASGIKREATNLRYERRAIGRKNDRVQTPDKRRDQKSMDRGEIIADARQALSSGNLGHESKKKIRRFPREADDRRSL